MFGQKETRKVKPISVVTFSELKQSIRVRKTERGTSDEKDMA